MERIANERLKDGLSPLTDDEVDQVFDYATSMKKVKTLTIEDLRKLQIAEEIFYRDDDDFKEKYFQEVPIKSELKNFLGFELVKELNKQKPIFKMMDQDQYD